MALHFLCGFVPIFIQYGDFAAAKRCGELQVLIARKRRARRVAAKGRK